MSSGCGEGEREYAVQWYYLGRGGVSGMWKEESKQWIRAYVLIR